MHEALETVQDWTVPQLFKTSILKGDINDIQREVGQTF